MPWLSLRNSLLSGYPQEHAPFDAIHVGAASPEMPEILKQQLKVCAGRVGTSGFTGPAPVDQRRCPMTKPQILIVSGNSCCGVLRGRACC